MLDPHNRNLLTELLAPPQGMAFDAGLTTTYTLDLLSLLSVPLHLAWLATAEEESEALLQDGIRLMEAFQRIGEHLSIYSDRGRIQVPGKEHALFGLLESSIVEVRAPHEGAFHPKLWVLRFVGQDDPDRILLRIGILSRNLTSDRSWDLILQVEGEPGKQYVAANRELGKFLAQLPELAASPCAARHGDLAQELADQVRKTRFFAPPPWEGEVSFHVLGMDRKPWKPPGSSQLAIISPFISPNALMELCATSKETLLLVSRPDQLAALDLSVRKCFKFCMALAEEAVTDDGEENVDLAERPTGLHAKAFLLEVGWYVHLFMGSANATDAALRFGHNVEVLAELRGLRSKLGKVDSLLDKDDFGGLLTEFDMDAPVTAPNPDDLAAEKILDTFQFDMAAANLGLTCTMVERDSWRLSLKSDTALDWPEMVVCGWLLSRREEQAVSLAPIRLGETVDMGLVSTAEVTGLLGIQAVLSGMTRRFALNLPVSGLPDSRDAAILRRLVRNKEGFMRYLRLLLGNLAGGFSPVWKLTGKGGGSQSQYLLTPDSLLEDMVKAFSRKPQRLDDIRRVVATLQEGGGDIVPPEFVELLKVFEAASGETR